MNLQAILANIPVKFQDCTMQDLRMEGQMDGWMDGRTDRWMDKQVDEQGKILLHPSLTVVALQN